MSIRGAVKIGVEEAPYEFHTNDHNVFLSTWITHVAEGC